MQTTNNAIDLQLIKNECESRIDSFFSQFGIATIARNSSIKKARGYSALTILLNIFVLPFIGKNIYRSIVINPKSDVGKDAIYEFMRSSNFGWRRFLLKLAFGVHEFVDPEKLLKRHVRHRPEQAEHWAEVRAQRILGTKNTESG